MINNKLRLIALPLLFCGILSITEISHAQTTPSAYTTAYRYDAARRLTGTISPDSDDSGTIKYAAVRNSYDTAGRLYKIEAGELAIWQAETIAPSAWGANFTIFQTIDTTYDSMDRKIKEVRSSGGTAYTVRQYSYDLTGRLECTAVRMNPAIFASLPTSACTLGAQGVSPNDYGPDRITKNVYDSAGEIIQVRRGVGTPLEQAYTTYSYTKNGKQEYVIDAAGNRAKLAYDMFDRQYQWMFPSKTGPIAFNGATQADALATAGSASTTDYEQYAYDNNGNRTSLKKRDGQTIGYTYDALNRLSIKDIPGGTGMDVYYDYDLRGLQLSARFGSTSGTGISSVYDNVGRMTSSATNMSGSTLTLGYEYDANGNRTRLNFPDYSANDRYFIYDYDGLDRMIDIKQSGATSVTTLAYNNKGERTALGGSVATTYSYDGISRLGSLTHTFSVPGQEVTYCMGKLTPACTVSYTPANQVLGRGITNDAFVFNERYNADRAYVANGLNQYITAGTPDLTYDDNGNLTAYAGSTYSYDVENRLTNASGSTSAILSYDPMGRLFQTTGTTTTRFLYDGDALVAEYDGSGNLLKRYVHGPGADEPVLWYEGSTLATGRYLRADHQGSIVAIADSTGARTNINSYDEYGVPASTNQGRFAYTGQIIIPELGMYHYKARVYAPRLGRFMQTDPVGYDDQINLYTYVANDPMNQTDPTGMCPWCVGAIIGGGIELVGQLSSSQDRAAWGTAINQVRNGDFQGAWQSSKSQVGRVVVATATGAVGGAISGKLLTAGIASDRVRVTATSLLGATTNAIQQAGSNIVDGKPVGEGVPTAAVLGGVIGGSAGAAGRAEAGKHLGLGTGNRAAEKAAGRFEATTQTGTRIGQSVIENVKDKRDDR